MMARRRKLNMFERGYLAAISNLISMHGSCTEAWDVFQPLQRSLREVLADTDLDEYDQENLSQLKSYDPDYRTEEID